MSTHLRSNHVIDVDVIVIIKLDEVDRRLCMNLLDDCAHLLSAIFVHTLHLLSNQSVKHFTRLSDLHCVI